MSFFRFAGFLRAVLAPALVLFALFAGPAAVAQQASEPFTPEQKKALETLVHEILVKNPEILVDAMHALDARQQEQAAQASRAAIAANAKEVFNDGHSFVAGNPKGDVTIVEFFDYRCPYCKQMQPHLQALLKEDGKIRLILKELPVLGPDSVLASRAAVAALAQQKGTRYYAFHDAMMGFHGQLTEAEVFRMAGEAGLDVTALKADMEDPRVEQALRANLALAQKLGIEGTPGFIVGGELIPGAVSLDSLRQLVKQARG
ncbi:MAG TPA: thioredoxin domain-containing protein [Ferrovibrio sp.]|uniref:DsbA family protein n=1 Tax=Ferrovibrio sp. TaxID=1917215 RepID=UPI002ED2E83B